MTKITKIAAAALLLFAGAVSAIQEVRFVSPLQSLTIPDPEVLEKVPESSSPKDGGEKEAPKAQRAMTTPRKRFLMRFREGLQAEKTAREKLALGMASIEDDASFDASGKDWVGQAMNADEKRKRKEDAFAESAHDAALAKYDAAALAKDAAGEKPQNPNKYQYVGLVDRNNKDKPVSWHARPKPKNAKWSVRMVHVNKDAIVKDLFDRGKIDIFAKYTNTGRQVQTEEKAEDGKTTITKTTNVPIVTTKYEARERSLKNLYNFSMKHFFTDSSGAYWRERRIRPGMYTDGESVYESSYRYRDGRNGMHKIGSLKQFLASSAVDSKDKEKILKSLKQAAPDVVLEL